MSGQQAISRNGVKKNALGFLSHNGETQIKAMLWTPEKKGNPRGIIQIVHGMSEYIERYDELACFFASRGFVVCGHDQIGHGDSVSDPSERGHMPLEGGKETLIEDVHTLRSMVASRYPRQVPYFLIGHSMGSFISRVYATCHGEHLSGVILVGTAHQSSFLSRVGGLATQVIAKLKGQTYRSDFVHNLGAGAYAKKIDDPRTPFDWIAVDEAVVDDYTADERCGFKFTVGGYAVVAQLIHDMTDSARAKDIPSHIPFLILSGKDDPVGEMGDGVKRAETFLTDAGLSDVQLVLYEGLRHEILNEKNREDIYHDILDWLMCVINDPSQKASGK